jgi:hypothetical protein
MSERAKRTWCLTGRTVEPGPDVTCIRDRDGVEWRRSSTDAHVWVKPAGRTVERHWSWAPLLAARGPLTEETP